VHPSHTRIAGARRTAPRTRLAALAALAALAMLVVALLLAPAAIAGATTGAHRRSCTAVKASHEGAHSARRSCRRRRTRAQRRLARARARAHARRAREHRVRTPRTASESSAGEAISASIATVLATPCTNTALRPEASNLALVRAAVLCLINRKRAENGEQPLVASADLEAAAESHTGELIAEDYFAHVAPSGETPVERIRDTGYLPSPEDGYILGENLAWGTYQLSTAQAIAEAWFNSPEHLANILESQYRETGVAVVAAVPAYLSNGAPGATYAQEFGDILQ
jgi:uncharacterized protein YkwD